MSDSSVDRKSRVRETRTCSVPTCKNKRVGRKDDTGPSFHRFPKDPAIRDAWIEQCHIDANFNPDHGCICSDHFDFDDFERSYQKQLMGIERRPMLKKNVIPHLNLPESQIENSYHHDLRNRNKDPKVQFKTIDVLRKEEHGDAIIIDYESDLESLCVQSVEDEHSTIENIQIGTDYKALYLATVEKYEKLRSHTCQFAPAPFGLDNFLFGGLGAFPPLPPPPIGPLPIGTPPIGTPPIGTPPIGTLPIGIENLFGQAQFAPGMPPMGGSYPVGPLPFPLFPMPCDMMCDHGPLFFANIAVTNPQQARPAGAAGMPGALPGAGGAGMLTTMRPGGAGGVPGGAAGGAAGAAGGAAGATGAARPAAGAAGAGGMGATGAAGAGGAGAGGMGATSARPPSGAGAATTMTTRPPTAGAGGAAGMMAQQQNPNVNVQIMSMYPNYPNWCTGWCRFFYRPRPMMPPPPPPPPPLPFPHPACLLFSWLGL
ncbi:hypothetical protein V9T40_006000 [Parthenolecanium corni]|uniref:THAP-type domain-containing protein n=1 Tax=Parthenolecanium corni TaxID=536013 RepID=A0AAN9U2N7_9HEMI